MKKLLSLLAIAACCSLGQASYAQNVEGQIIAAQYGEFVVPGQYTGSFQFPSATCQVSGGGKNFDAFATGVAVKIVDSNPTLTEVATPSSVFINQCVLNMSTSHVHVPPYYLTSGTGGLQEAILYGANRQGGPNTIILNAEWYTLIQPRSAATVIASVAGNTTVGLVDVTTSPYTAYTWNGSQYIAASSPKAINGISYSTAYAGSTVDVRVNACIADAMNLANGNFTGICDASGETGIKVTAAQITLGNSSGTPVTLYVPAQGQWRGGMTDGTSVTMLQYGNTSIAGKGPESGIGTQFVFGATATSSLAYVFKLQPLVSQLNYVNDSNFAIVNVNGGPYVGAVTSQGIGAYFQGSMFDSSTLDHIVVFDSLDAISAYMPGWCCGATMRNVSINGNYGTGVTPLVISGTSALNLETLSVVHPGVGKPAMQVTDSTFNVSNLNIHGLYIETSNSDTTTALIQLQGYGSVFIDHLTAKAEATSMSAPIITSTSATNTGITVDGFTAVNGGGNWQLPVTVINDSSTGQVVKGDSTGSKSNLGFFTSTVLASGSAQVGTGFGTSQFATSSACETAFGITTLSTSASFTNTGLNCLPANAIIDAVVYRVTTTITGAGVTGFTIGDTITATRFCGTQSTLTAGTTGVCLAQAGGTAAQASAGKISVSTGSTPSAGAIRLVVYYHTWTAPTS